MSPKRGQRATGQKQGPKMVVRPLPLEPSRSGSSAFLRLCAAALLRSTPPQACTPLAGDNSTSEPPVHQACASLGRPAASGTSTQHPAPLGFQREAPRNQSPHRAGALHPFLVFLRPQGALGPTGPCPHPPLCTGGCPPCSSQELLGFLYRPLPAPSLLLHFY